MLAEILACPVCHEGLDSVSCSGCGRTYAVNDGALDLTPVPPPDASVRERWGLWEELQANGQRAYELDPPSSLSVGERHDAAAFANFSDLDGLVLDVGCGVQALPSYARGVDDAYVGIDPLRGEREREFGFVQGIAEYLPFRDRTFDRVLFATSIDHVLVPELAAGEAYRVTKAGGAVCVWIGEVPDPSELPPPGLFERIRQRIRPARSVRIQTPRLEMTFVVPEGAIDPFHVAHPTAETVVGWLEQAGFVVQAVERPLEARCFVRALRER